MALSSDEELLKAVEAIYATALSPAEYESFAAAWDAYTSSLNDETPPADGLIRHIENAISIVERLHFAAAHGDDPKGLVDNETAPAAVVTAEGDVLESNNAWRDFGPAVQKSLWRLVGAPADIDALKRAMRAINDVTDKPTTIVHVTNSSGLNHFVAIRRICDSGDKGAPSPLYLVRVAHALWSPEVESHLASQFQLTAAELSLLRRMTGGHRFSEIAEMTGRKAETLKSQSKSIYSKMRVSGREEAVRMALYLHLFMNAATNKGPEPAVPGEGGATMPDRARIIWTKAGAPAGRPFLFLHGMSLGHGMTDAFKAALAGENLTAYRLDRPGYGRSDPPRDWRRNVEEWIDMFPALLDCLGLERAPIVSHTSGVLYACAAAARHPDRVSGVCALAGGIPITDRKMLADYPLQARIIARTAQISPRALRFVIASAAAFYDQENGTRRLIAKSYSSAPSDAEALKNPEIYNLVCDGMQMISNGGLDGFVGDGCVIFGDWSDYVRDMQAPLRYVIGEEDPICPLGWARAFAQKFTHVDVTALPRAGQLLHHARPHAVVGEIAGFLRELN